jgi:hypothetical protein
VLDRVFHAATSSAGFRASRAYGLAPTTVGQVEAGVAAWERPGGNVQPKKDWLVARMKSGEYLLIEAARRGGDQDDDDKDAELWPNLTAENLAQIAELVNAPRWRGKQSVEHDVPTLWVEAAVKRGHLAVATILKAKSHDVPLEVTLSSNPAGVWGLEVSRRARLLSGVAEGDPYPARKPVETRFGFADAKAAFAAVLDLARERAWELDFSRASLDAAG